MIEKANEWVILDLIVAEFNSDIMSVQCFDARIVERAKQLVKENKEIINESYFDASNKND